MVTIASFGPWPMPPLMASTSLAAEFVSELSQALTVLTNNDAVFGLMARWAEVDDHHLDPMIGFVQTLHDPSLFP
jgi:ABC-type phosphate/phosphonate transport system substrate-binding protein